MPLEWRCSIWYTRNSTRRNKTYPKFRLIFLFKKEKQIYILPALPERGRKGNSWYFTDFVPRLKSYSRALFLSRLYCQCSEACPTDMLNARMTLLNLRKKPPVKAVVKKALKPGLFYWNVLEVSGASRSIRQDIRDCGLPLNNYLNHPRTEEHLCSVAYNTRMVHHRFLPGNTKFPPIMHHSTVVKNDTGTITNTTDYIAECIAS